MHDDDDNNNDNEEGKKWDVVVNERVYGARVMCKWQKRLQSIVKVQLCFKLQCTTFQCVVACPKTEEIEIIASVTRFGNFLHFEQPFKAGGNNYFTQITHILGDFCKGVKIIHFSSEFIFGQLL